MAIDEKFAKPHSAYVTIVKLRFDSALPTPGSPNLAKAMNSLSTMRSPRRLPTIWLSFHETPIAHAIGLKIRSEERRVGKGGRRRDAHESSTERAEERVPRG